MKRIRIKYCDQFIKDIEEKDLDKIIDTIPRKLAEDTFKDGLSRRDGLWSVEIISPDEKPELDLHGFSKGKAVKYIEHGAEMERFLRFVSQDTESGNATINISSLDDIKTLLKKLEVK